MIHSFHRPNYDAKGVRKYRQLKDAFTANKD